MFKKSVIACFFLLMLPAVAVGQSHDHGGDYREVDREYRLTDKPGEVVEFFWYGCGGCFAFLPAVEEWKQALPEDVAFVRVPAVLNPRWRIHGKAYYVAESLDMVEEIHQPMFNALHAEGRRLMDRDSIRDFFVEQGADPEEFDAAFDSFQVDAKLRRAENLARRFGIRATPSVVINGKFVSDLSSAGGPDGLVEVGNHLLEQAE